MRRFLLGVAIYAAACLIAAAAIVIRGEGPHPRIVALYPTNGDRYWPGGAAQISFSQAMDQGSVERALEVTPGAEGQAAWFGNTLNLQPVGDWKPNITYHVVLTGTVGDSQGRTLHTPVSWWFRVHHVGRLAFCRVAGVRNVCEPGAGRAVTHSPRPVSQYALSPDGTLLAYIRPAGASGLPHLFIVRTDGSGAQQLTAGGSYVDSDPTWAAGDNSSVTYHRRRVLGPGRLGPLETWNINVDGSNNARL
jgi:hypothetical protein